MAEKPGGTGIQTDQNQPPAASICARYLSEKVDLVCVSTCRFVLLKTSNSSRKTIQSAVIRFAIHPKVHLATISLQLIPVARLTLPGRIILQSTIKH